MRDLVQALVNQLEIEDISVGICRNHFVLTCICRKDLPWEEIGWSNFLNLSLFDPYPAGEFQIYYYAPSSGYVTVIVPEPQKPWSLTPVEGTRHITPVRKSFTQAELERLYMNKEGLKAPLQENKLLILAWKDVPETFRMNPFIFSGMKLKVHLNGRKYDAEREGIFAVDGDRSYYICLNPSETSEHGLRFHFADTRAYEIPALEPIIVACQQPLKEDDPKPLVEQFFKLMRSKLIDPASVVDGVFCGSKEKYDPRTAAVLMNVGLRYITVKDKQTAQFVLDPLVPQGFGPLCSNHPRVLPDNQAPSVSPQVAVVKGHILTPRQHGFCIQLVDDLMLGGESLPYLFGQKNEEGEILLLVDGKETRFPTPFLLIKRGPMAQTVRDLMGNIPLLEGVERTCDIFRNTLAEKKFSKLDPLMATLLLMKAAHGSYIWNNRLLKRWTDRAAETSEVHVEKLHSMIQGNYLLTDARKALREVVALLSEGRKTLLKEINNENR